MVLSISEAPPPHVSRPVIRTILLWHLAALVLVVGIAMASWVRHRHQFDAFMIRAGLEYDVPPRLLAAVIWKESRFQPDAVGGAGEIGLMQITELVGYEWAGAHELEDFVKTDLFDPQTNLRAGAWYLAKGLDQWDRYEDPLPFALAQYNAGYGNAKRWARKALDADAFIDNITYPNTQRYVRDILKRYRGRY